jgi:hypothetical protein
MKKYNPSHDIPKFVRKYRTVKPSELVRIISKEKGITRSLQSVCQWFKRHPDKYAQLLKEINYPSPKKKPSEIPEVYAKLSTYSYGSIEIIDLDTLNVAREKLALVEEELRTDICEKENLNVFTLRSHGK